MLRAAELRHDTPLLEAVETLGNGRRVSCQDTVPWALWLALSHLDSYERAVRKAIAAGDDTDTTAAIVGSIVAAHGGVASNPAAVAGARRADPGELNLLRGDADRVRREEPKFHNGHVVGPTSSARVAAGYRFRLAARRATSRRRTCAVDRPPSAR
jgi:hypothetical protein